jgi:class 3 adenylate cyclase
MDPKTRYAKTADGVNIAYAVFGEGPLIGHSSQIWGALHMMQTGVLGRREHITKLVDMGWSVALYDCRGTGSSERDVGDFSLAARVRDLEAVIDQLGAERFPLFGETQGSPVALEYAVSHPERVSHLILSNPFASGADYYASIPAMGLVKAMRDMAEAQWEFFTQSLASAVTAFRDAGEVQAVAAMMRTGMSPAAFAAFRDETEKIDITDRLPLVRAPTLVVRDESLALSSASLARTVAAGIPNARFVVTIDLADAIAEFISGRPADSGSQPAAEGAVRAVLFTDLVGHTEMMQRLGDDRGRDVLREHERITREVLKANGGTEVKTMGDGFMASFGSVTKAVECAMALQRAVEEWNRGVGAQQPPDGAKLNADAPAVAAPLEVRCGLNAGEPIEEDGDLFGATVILASRIAAKADGGEILVADTVRGLCSGKGFLFADRGEFVAKGFEDPVRLYEVSWRE